MDDIESHRPDVQGVADKGRDIIATGRVDELQRAEVKNELLVLRERWEKLTVFAERFNKRWDNRARSATNRK